MTQTFIDTIVVCSLTGFVIIATGAWTRTDPATGQGWTGAPLTIEAFSTGLPGAWGGMIVAAGLALFAFSTILGWAYYGERNIEYLLGPKAVLPYRVAFIAGRPASLEMPEIVSLKVAMTAAPEHSVGVASNVTKEATLENGLQVRVPLFIKTGDTIRIDTRTRTYAGKEHT